VTRMATVLISLGATVAAAATVGVTKLRSMLE
jgi:hypothetical protein